MFSDGLPDQFGGPKGKKFMSKQLQDIINAKITEGIAEIGTSFENNFELWKNGYDQTDDVTFVGIQF